MWILKKWKKKTRKSFRSTIQSVRILDQPISSSKFPPGHLGTLNEFEPICLNIMVGVSLWCARCLLFAEEAISQASPQSATNPKLAHPPLRNYGKPLHPHFSRSLQKTIRFFVRYFALDFFVKQAPAPPLLTECLLVVSKWITFMHQIPNGINHSIAFPPINCVK